MIAEEELIMGLKIIPGARIALPDGKRRELTTVIIKMEEEIEMCQEILQEEIQSCKQKAAVARSASCHSSGYLEERLFLPSFFL